MIGKNALSTYAQYNEDLVLKALLSDVKGGFYIDVGANDPGLDSVTKLFYQSGWTGINIEPIKKQLELFKVKRPRDINLCLGVGEEETKMLFREYSDISGHSTFSESYISEESASLKFTEYMVEIVTLKKILSKHAPKKPIDFMKIDVEGFEYEVIKGNDWSEYRPSILCIEANHQETKKDWDAILRSADYKQFIFDGLNAYYVAIEKWSLTEGYAERIVRLNHASLSEYQKVAWIKDSKMIRQLQEQSRQLEDQLLALHAENDHLRRTSYWNQSFKIRLKRAVKSLTVDWIRYKRRAN
jgi:FkbM family methyltransferase